jgi:signal peptidase II
MNKKFLYLIVITCLIVAIDQLTKMYITMNFRLHESFPIIKDIFHITYVRNTGAAFGIFRDANITFRTIFFLSLPPIAMLVIFFLLKASPDKDKIQNLALSLVFAGALGNYIDRVRFQYVIDFLDFHYKQVWSYPAFNVADMSIVTGVFLLFIFMIKDEMNKSKSK